MSPAVAAVSDRPAPVRRAAPVPDRAPARLSPASSPPRSATAAGPVAGPATTRERVRAAVTEAVSVPRVGTAPQEPSAEEHTTRARVAAALAPAAKPQQAAKAGNEATTVPGTATDAVVVDLGARRAATTAGPSEARTAALGTTPEGRLAPVVPLAPRQGPENAGPRVREAQPARTRDTGQAQGRGPPPAEPAAPGSARPTTTSPVAGTPAAAPGRVTVLADRRVASARAPPAASVGTATPGATGAATPAAEPAAPVPAEAPVVLAFKARAGAAAVRTVAHTRGKPAADNAQAASKPDPDRDVAGQAAGNRVTSMDSAADEPAQFDAAVFKADIKAAVEKIAPPSTLDEADRFEESGKAGEAAAIAQGLVKGGQTATEKPIATSTSAPPDRSGLQPKPVGDLANDPVGRAPDSVGAGSVVPAPKPAVATDFSAGPRSVDDAMAARDITVPQLEEANEPRFAAALGARQAVVDQAAVAEPAYRGEEAVLLPTVAADASAQETQALTGMHAARVGALHDARGAKSHTRDEDQQRRNDVNQALLDIHADTKGNVERILRTLDKAVTTMFTEGEADARSTFEHYVAVKMEEYKDERYGGFGGGALWLKDRFFDLPDEVNAFYEQGRSFYLSKLDRTIDAIAVTIGASLTLATLAIRFGRWRVKQLLTTLPAGLLQLGVDTAQQLDQRFDLLTSDVSAARDHLVDVVARAYVDSTKKLDDRITELKEENKGLATRAIEFAEEVGHTIAELGRLLWRVLVKTASVVGSILRHPIRFFGHLVDAVGDGLSLFVDRIGKHLEDALLDLLFGDLGKSGITLPRSLDFAGLFDLVCRVLQIRWVDLRARLVDKIGLPAVLHLEQVADVFRLLVDKGVGGLWELAAQRLAELPGLVIGALRTYVVEQVVKAGIAYIVALLTPASAFIKACEGIYQLLSFIVQKARQIAGFIDAVLDSLAAIAEGDTAATAERIDAALAGALGVALGFLAKLAHLDAIADKARSVIEAIRTPVRRAVDGILDGAIALFHRGVGAERGREPHTPATHAAPAVAAPQPGAPRPAAQQPAAHQALPPATRLPDAIDEPIRIGGVIHHLKDDGPGGTLALHTATMLVNRIADPALQLLVSEFNTAPTKEGKHAAAVRVAQWIASNMPPSGPGGSAPNIGKIERHGSQPPRLDNAGVPLWSLRSEHVVPFAVVRGLWAALGAEGDAKRKHLGLEDASLTTIMIYKGAGDAKDVGEASRRGSAARYLEVMTEAYARQPDADTPAADAVFRQHVMTFLRGEQAWFTDFAWQKVQGEHASLQGTSTHGALRVEPAPVPGSDTIGNAATLELADAEQILDEALTELERP